MPHRQLPEFAAQRAHIASLIETAGLGAPRDTILASLRAAIRLRNLGPADAALGSSKVGGEPDLPEDATWPRDAEGPLQFVLQVDLATTAPYDVEGLLPQDGVLSVFCDSFARTVHITHISSNIRLRRHAWSGRRPPFRQCPLHASGELQLAPPGSAFVDALQLSSDDFSAYWDDVWLPWRDEVRPGPAGACGIHQMLGYAVAENQEEQDPTEQVVIGFDSDDRAFMEWGDVHCVWALLQTEALARHDWSKVRAAM